MENDHLDREALAELREVMGDEFPVLLNTYLNDSRMRIEALRSALDSLDLVHFSRIAHSLKGSCVNVGAGRLGQYCMAAERAGRTGKIPQAMADLAAIESEFTLIAREMDGLLSR